MPQEFDRQLATIAEHARRTGRLDAPAAVRARADRRRRRRYAATGALGAVAAGALGVGIAIAQPPAPVTPPPVASSRIPAPSTAPTPSAPASATPSRPPSSAPSSSAPPSSAPPSARSSAPSAAPNLYSGDRQVTLVPVVDGRQQRDAALAVGADGRIQPTGEGDRALFVPVPVSPGAKRYLLKTGTIRSGGEPQCMSVASGGESNPLILVAAACDASDRDQIVQFRPAGKGTQHIELNGVYLTWFPDGEYGLIAQESGEGDSMRPFAVLDRGAATLPQIGD
jgi:hypothetical protein